MPIYTYKGLDKTGKDVKGSLTAEGLFQAKSKLKMAGVMLTGIREKKASPQTQFSSPFLWAKCPH